MKLNKIIVPTDFSDSSFSAIHYASEMALKWDADIHLLYIYDNLPQIISNDNSTESENLINSEEDIARKKIKELASEYQDKLAHTVIPAIRSGINYEEIIKYAEEIESELIVIATQGRSGIMHTLLGSVAEKVIQLAKCPVLVVKPKDDDDEF